MRKNSPYQWSVKQGAVIFPDWSSLIARRLRVSGPESMTGAQAQDFAAARKRLLQEQRLPEEEIQSAYRTLFLSPIPLRP